MLCHSQSAAELASPVSYVIHAWSMVQKEEGYNLVVWCLPSWCKALTLTNTESKQKKTENPKPRD